MSLTQFPARSFSRIQIGNQYHDLEVEAPPESCPQEIQKFLIQVGWGQNGQDADTYEPLFVKMQEAATENMRYRWYEALAYEFWKFLTLTNGND